MRRGEVWRIQLPYANGREQAGERPAVIIEANAYIPAAPLVMIIPFTGELTATRFEGTLLVQPDQRNGLTKPSVALVFQTRGLDKRRFLTRLGTLDEATLEHLLTLFDRLTGR
jgi:mRNA interferase MazF